MKKSLVGMSKFLSLVLRHDPDKIGITLDKEGWTDIEELIKCANIYQKTEGYDPMTRVDIGEIVQTNNKKRFEIDDAGWSIRASQGHSISDVKITMDEKVPPKYLYHGTAKRFVDAILKNGLSKMKRNHVHLNDDPDQSKIVGKRHGVPVVLRVNAEEMISDGHKFYLSKNKVWLIEAVPSEYLEEGWEDES